MNLSDIQIRFLLDAARGTAIHGKDARIVADTIDELAGELERRLNPPPAPAQPPEAAPCSPDSPAP